MENSIRGAKGLIDKQILDRRIENFGTPFSEYQKVYFSTNENINGYLNLVDFNNKDSALSVMSSGDHIFNLITNNILNIDTFDTNKLTEYYVLGLKRALVLKCNYKEYLKSISILMDSNSDNDRINELIYDLLPFMDRKYRIYWCEILDYNYKEQKLDNTNLNLIKMLFINTIDVSHINNYLMNEDNYNKLKENIIKTNISFKCVDAVNLSSEFDKKYDFILLSNILDYFYKFYGMNWRIDKLEKYVDGLHNLTREDATVFVNYIYNYYSKYRERVHNLIALSHINKSHLDNYIVEKLPIYELDKLKNIGAGMILSKKG